MGEFPNRVKALELASTRIRKGVFWQNVNCERVIGTIRQECTDHLLILNERHLGDVLREYAAYYNEARTHLSLKRNAPEPRAREPVADNLIAAPILGGLHHRYRSAA